MTKVKGVVWLTALAGMVAATGGCVSRSTHNKVLAELSRTQGELAASRDHNARLRSGLTGLAQECGTTMQRVKSADSAVAKLRETEQRASDCLAEMRQILDSHARFLGSLQETMDPLEGELSGLRDRASALAGQPQQSPGLAPGFAPGGLPQ